MIKTRIAFIVVTQDYHDLAFIAHAIQEPLSYKEIGMINSGADYVGVIYSGHTPGDTEINELLLDAGITLDPELIF